MIEWIQEEIKIKPKYIFCHSEDRQSYSRMPGYYIVYNNPKELAHSLQGEQDKIRKLIDEILRENDKSGFYSADKVKIEFLDAVTSASNMYGMSRED